MSTIVELPFGKIGEGPTNYVDRSHRITVEFLRAHYTWDNCKPDMVDRVIRAIASGASTIVACTGAPWPNSVITWDNNSPDCPLWAGNFAFRQPTDTCGESVLAVPR